MFRFTRRGTLKNASYLPKAIGWATEFNSYFNDNYDVELHFGIETFGSNQMFWYVDVDELNTIDEVNLQIMQDQQYWELIEKASDFWVDGSLNDTIVKMLG